MKKLTFLLAVVLASCGQRDFSKLQLNVDKVADVEKKLGKPDSLSRRVVMGETGEFWYFRKDSVALLFVNDVLTRVTTAEDVRIEMRKADQMRDSIIEIMRKDSIAAVEMMRRDSIEAAINAAGAQ